MAKQSLVVTSPGTTLPAGGTIINANFTELYNILGGSTLPTLSDGAVAFAASGAWSQDATNFLYTTSSGPRLQVGISSGTSAGVIMGYGGAAGQGRLWSTGVTPSTTNWGLSLSATQTDLLGQQEINVKMGATTTIKTLWVATAGAGPAITAGTATTDVQALSATQTWNAAGVAFTGWKFTITDTASAAGSRAMQILGGASGTTNWFKVAKNGAYLWTQAPYAVAENVVDALGFGAVTDPQNFPNIAGTYGAVLSAGDSNPFGGVKMGLALASGGKVSWDSTTSAAAGSPDTAIGRFAANGVVFGTSVAAGGSVTSRAEINKAVTAFTDGVAKTVFTLTIPNAAHSASYLVRLTGSIGAGGAIGANEATATNCYVVSLTRTAGVNATAAISAAFGAAATNVAGATTVTCTGTLAAVSGAVGATNTIDIQATITKGGGTSDNHTIVATASLLNANASGITIA